MTDELDVNEIARAAQEALSGRIAVVKELAAAQQLCVDRRAELADAEAAHAQAYAQALREGWSASALREFGLTAPARKNVGRPRKGSGESAADEEAEPTLEPAGLSMVKGSAVA